MKKNVIFNVIVVIVACLVSFTVFTGCGDDDLGKEKKLKVKSQNDTGCTHRITKSYFNPKIEYETVKRNNKLYLAVTLCREFNCGVTKVSVDKVFVKDYEILYSLSVECPREANCVCPREISFEAGPLAEGKYKLAGTEIEVFPGSKGELYLQPLTQEE